MGNRLFQLAEAAVHRAETSTHAVVTGEEAQEALTKVQQAKNDISSAFANATAAEQQQLQELRNRLEESEKYVKQEYHNYLS